LKNILLINTGGTIASVPGPSGLSPSKISIQDGDSVDLLSLDSTDIGPSQWLVIAGAVREHYERYDGFVITHGTDTLSFTAAGLSAIIENSPKPIVLTGSQIPAYREDSDAPENVRDAFTYASSPDAFGVHVVFAGHVIDGMCVRKIRSNSRESMTGVNVPDDAFFRDGELVVNKTARDAGYGIRTDCHPDCGPDHITGRKTVFHDRLNENVCILRLYPGIRKEFLEYAYSRYDGLILETFGCGGIPGYVCFDEIVQNAARTIPVVVCTQVLYEGTDLKRYEVGQRLLALPGVREAGLMTAEAAYARLMVELS